MSTNHKHPFPTGRPINLINQSDLREVKIIDGRFTFLNEKRERVEFQGVMQLRIHCKRDLFIPFIPMKTADQRTLVGCCATCCQSRSTSPCEHSVDERAFVGTYCTDEILYAVEKLGYEILDIYEIVAYTEKSDLFSVFFSVFSSLRLRFSGFPKGVVTDEQKQLYCDELNLRMGFKDVFTILHPHMITLNESERQFYKLLLNSLLAKWFSRLADVKLYVIVPSAHRSALEHGVS